MFNNSIMNKCSDKIYSHVFKRAAIGISLCPFMLQKSNSVFLKLFAMTVMNDKYSSEDAV